MSEQSKCVKILGLILGLSFYVGEGLNYSQLGPFFPTEASHHKGVSTTFIGIITGAFDVANFIAAFALASFIQPKNQKFFFCTGALISASCNGLFGIMGFSVGGTPFIVVCTAVRFVMGIGASMVWSTGVPLLVPMFPQWAGRITSLIETSIGLGLMVGPSVGSALYSLGGYTTPFVVAAATQIVFAFLCILFLPGKPPKNHKPDLSQMPTLGSEHVAEEMDPPGFSFVYFSTRLTTICACLPIVFHASYMGFLDVALGPYLHDVYGVTGETSGYYFLAFSGVYALSAPLLGFLVDKGHAGRMYLISCLTAAVAFSFLWLQSQVPEIESRWCLILCLMLIGVSNASSFTSVYLIFETVAYKIGFKVESKVKLMTAALLNASFASGRMIGPILIGGFFMDHFGYYTSFLLVSSLLLFCTIPCFYVLSSRLMLHRIYYPGEGGEKEHANLAVKYESFVESVSLSGKQSIEGTQNTSHLSYSANFVHQSVRCNPILSIK